MNQVVSDRVAPEGNGAIALAELSRIDPISTERDLVRLSELVARLEKLHINERTPRNGSGFDAPTIETSDQWQHLLKTVASLQGERDKAVASLALRFNEIVTLTQLFETTRSHESAGRSEILTLKQQVVEGRTKSERLRVSHAKLTAKVKGLEEQVQRQQLMQDELVARLTQSLAVTPIQKLVEQVRGMRYRIASVDRRRRALRAGGKTFPGGAGELERCTELLEKSVFFDAAWYLERYPDVAETQALPQLHYLRYGAAEGRDPGPLFSTSRYLVLHPDVALSKVNPLIHYITHGIKERRVIEPAQVK
jgi:hypothetical protein